MHLVFVTSLVTDGKPTTGFEVANEAIVHGLRDIGCRVTVVGFRQPRQQPISDADTIVVDTLAVENAGASALRKLQWLAGALIRGLPVGGNKLRAVSWVKLKSVLDTCETADGLIINSVQMPSAFPQLLDYKPFIYVAHNVEHASARQNAHSSANWLEGRLYARDARLLEPTEARLCDRARHVFVLSEDDRQVLALGENKASVLPLVFPQEENPVGEGVQVEQDIGLIGTWTWQPNLVGLNWFLEEVVPQLDRDLTVRIAGSTPSLPLPERPGVRFVGRVEDAAIFVAQSGVLALVSRSGTGVQLKTIEAFQSGTPCVATASAVRGIETIPANCRVADDAGDFAEALNKLAFAVRSGETGPIDGSKFAEDQRRGLHQALETGCSRLGAATG